MTPAPPPAQSPAAGIAMLVAALFLFSLQDIVVKLFADRYSVFQIVFVRGVVALVPMVCLVWVAARAALARVRRWDLLVWRGVLGLGSFVAYYLAIAAMPLAEAVTIVFTAPVFATALSALVLREPVGPQRWAAVAIGFLAVAVVVGPSGRIGSLGTVLALAAALTYAGQTLITRRLGDSVPASIISTAAMLVFVAGSLLGALLAPLVGEAVAGDDPSLRFLLRAWTWPVGLDLALLVLLGVNAAFGFYLLTRAYVAAPISAVAPFEYSYVIWAVLFGYLIWDEVPAPTTLAGLLLLIASSLYILHRELRGAGRGRGVARRTAPAESDVLVRPAPVTAPAPAAVAGVAGEAGPEAARP